MKQQRQDVIRQIISENAVETQEELLRLLTQRGFETTQATISRDIRKLGITKIAYEGNKHKYIIGTGVDKGASASYKQVMGTSIVSMDYSENIIVIKTVSGMAMAVGAAIDNLSIGGIMGCIAGDDTLFLAIKEKNMAGNIIESIRKQHM